MTWKRARSEEQRQYRISEIVNATARLYRKHSFEEISFTLIAKEAGFTRSNLYRYFSSKEEIFLAFLKQEIVALRRALVRNCQGREALSVERFVSVWVETLSKRKRLLNLLSIMNSFLEKNVSEQCLVEFKRYANEELKALSTLLCQKFPALSSEKAGEFIELQLASAIGLYQITNLSEMQQRVLEYPEFRPMKVDFSGYLQKAIECLLHGLMAS